jgi:predicted AAA+ superfamily ATPase
VADGLESIRTPPGCESYKIHRLEADEILLDRASAESLAGRASLDTLHTCSVHELTSAGVVPATAPLDVLLRGGWPELYADRARDAARFLDDFVLTYIEKDVVIAGGITQRGAFLRVLRLLAARTAQVQNHADIAQNVDVQVSTVSGWVSSAS